MIRGHAAVGYCLILLILCISPLLVQEYINFKDVMNFTEMSLSTGLTSLLSRVYNVSGWFSVMPGGSYK